MNKITQIKSEIDLYFILLAGTSFAAILASLFFLGQGYTNVYPHLFYIPIILAAYRYLNRGILFGIFLSALYLILHIIILPDPEALTEAVARAVVMAGAGVITGMLSGKLLEGEKRFRMFADNSADIIYRYDLLPVPHFSFVSDAVTGITGYTPEEHYKDPMLGEQIVHPDDHHILESIREGKEMTDPLTIRWVRKDGGIVYVEQSYKSIRDPEGQLIAIEGIGRDITKQRDAERSQKRLASIVESSYDAILSLDTDANLLTWNLGAEEIFGWRAEEIIGKHYSLVIPPGEDRAIFDQYFKEMIATKKPHSREVNRLHSSGRILRISLSMSPILDRDGNIIAISGILRDITEQKEMEETLQKNSLYTRALIEASLDPLVTISPKGLITDVNRATEKITGLHRNQLIGSDFANYFTNPDKAREGYIETFNSGFVKDYALTIHHTSGDTIDVLYNASVYSDEKGAVQGVFAAARDVTKEKRMMQQIQENLLEKETLLREIHHRVKNNLQVVISLLNLQSLTYDDSRIKEVFRESENRITSMALVHEHLYKSEKLSRITIESFMRRLIKEIVQSYRDDDQIRVTCTIDDLNLDVDTAIYCGFIVNELISNSLKHAFKGREEGNIAISIKQNQNKCIILSVKDDGIGMPYDFDPDTAQSLGIVLLRTFTRQIQGRYSLSTLKGEGTQWQIRFRDENTSP
ncbi:PAS domain S-box protein [Methanocalculus sp.]|uniref:PAS domain S-box protein n=1 Tax=Methanocalculus sp. TaxID=2004547 RepID=UPI00262F3042|nr:PAS domain S-box protein [Methanocalculus sp.]MDG6250784.1 PAS domain S-box protein [Methanocalculus sp.]